MINYLESVSGVSYTNRRTFKNDFPGKKAAEIKENVADGTCQLIIGTHSLLSKTMSFNNLGLLIIDEEQHFGVAQKEQLKKMRGNIHVLALSATPIPRTLQMALSGVREMSLITTPPVDRLAVRTFVGPWDSIILREAIMREKNRGGQVFLYALELRICKSFMIGLQVWCLKPLFYQRMEK